MGCRSGALAIAGLLSACSSRLTGASSDDDGSGGHASSSGAPVTTASDDGGTEFTTGATSSADGPADSGTTTVDPADSSAGAGDDDCAFLCTPDVGDDDRCDVWAQDCPVGEKCMPVALEGENVWSRTACVPVVADPHAPGEACTVVGSGVSGLDDCETGAMCWDVDPKTLEGICIAMCGGTNLAPVCEDPRTECHVYDPDLLVLCLPPCDPFGQDCGDGWGCLAHGRDFECGYVASRMGIVGDHCVIGEPEDCEIGLYCAPQADVPDCMTEGCCSALCNLDEADPDAACGLPGQICVPWYGDAMAPPGLAHVGACAVP